MLLGARLQRPNFNLAYLCIWRLGCLVDILCNSSDLLRRSCCVTNHVFLGTRIGGQGQRGPRAKFPEVTTAAAARTDRGHQGYDGINGDASTREGATCGKAWATQCWSMRGGAHGVGKCIQELSNSWCRCAVLDPVSRFDGSSDASRGQRDQWPNRFIGNRSITYFFTWLMAQ